MILQPLQEINGYATTNMTTNESSQLAMKINVEKMEVEVLKTNRNKYNTGLKQIENLVYLVVKQTEK